ncbi:MAG TPA: SDR family NAD(P)-dependent oxidoreductase, partial [Trueperaceae bacterium]
YRINLRAPYLLTQGLLPYLNDASHVLFINSGSGLRANAGWSQYAISKFGLRALADSLRQEVASRIRVTSIYPGRTASPMQERVRRLEGKAYDPNDFVRPEDVALQVVAALKVSDGVAVTDVSIRPS